MIGDSMHVFSRNELDRIPWADDADGDYARRMLAPLMGHGALKCIANVDAEVRVLAAGRVVLPLVVVDGRGQHQVQLRFRPHLPRRRRLPWQVLAGLSEQAAVPLMRRLGL